MAEKHEFDMSLLRRESSSPEPHAFRLETEIRDISLEQIPSWPPPPYTDPYTEINVTYRGFVDDLSPVDQAFTNSSLPGSVLEYDLFNGSRHSEQPESHAIADYILGLRELPASSQILRRRRGGSNFMSDVVEPPESTAIFTIPQSVKTRRYKSRTFPADAYTQPHLRECYPEPYGASTNVSLLPPCPRVSDPTRHTVQELSDLRSLIKALEAALELATRGCDYMRFRFPEFFDEPSFNRIRELPESEVLYLKMLNRRQERKRLMDELESSTRRHITLRRELERYKAAKELIREIAREKKERAEGREWLRGDIKWADCTRMGRGLVHLTDNSDMMRRRLSYDS